MFSKLVVKLTVTLLKNVTLANQDRIVLTNSILHVLKALPIRDALVVNENGRLMVNGREIDLETAKILRESAKAALTSQALRIINDQVSFIAITTGVHQADNPWSMIFGKSALWYGQQQDKFLKILAGVDGDEE